MKTTLRRCMISDAPKIHELCQNELGYEFSLEQVEANIRRLNGNPDNFLLVAADQNDEVVAFIHASSHNPIYAPPMKSIMAVVVAPSHRKQGLGTMLLNAAEDWARKSGAAGLRVNSGAEKNAGVFYKKHGFAYIHTVYNYRKMF